VFWAPATVTSAIAFKGFSAPFRWASSQNAVRVGSTRAMAAAGGTPSSGGGRSALSSYAQRAPVARHIRQTPTVARLLHCSSRGGAAPAKLVTERAAGCSQSTWTGHVKACQRCLTLSAGRPRASATVHTQRNGVGAIPAHRLIRPWAAPGPPRGISLTPSRPLHGPRMISPRSPSSSRTSHGAPCGAGGHP